MQGCFNRDHHLPASNRTAHPPTSSGARARAIAIATPDDLLAILAVETAVVDLAFGKPMPIAVIER
jgi:hypothetical protein